MSLSRIALLSFLVLILVGTLAMGGVLVYRQFPQYRMGQAQAAIERKDYESAILNLKKLLHRDPANVEARLLFVDTIRNYSISKGRSGSYAANPEAVRELAKAAEFRSHDMNLQRRLLGVYLQIGDLGKAAEVAVNVAADEPTNADAHFALTWKAVEQDDEAQVARLFQQFNDGQIATPRLFHILYLQRKHHWEKEDVAASDKVLEVAAEEAKRRTSEELGLLVEADRLIMLGLLIAHQERAADPQTALDRMKNVVEATKKLEASNLGNKATLANATAQSLTQFNRRFRNAALHPDQRRLRNELAREVENLGTGALVDAAERDVNAPLVIYWDTARTLLSRREYEKALDVLREGIAAGESLDERSREGLLNLHLQAARVSIMKRDFDAANTHLDALLGDQRFEGWSHLLKGSVALHQGRLQLAHEEFLKSKKSMGDKILVRMSLAHTHMARKEWSEAIKLLSTMQFSEDQLTDEERAWHRHLLGGGQQIQYDLLRARLALGRWDDAQQNLAALKNTNLAPRVWAMVVTYLWEDEKDKAKAYKYIKLVREKYPQNLPLVLVEARLLKEDGKSNAATKLLSDFANAHPDEATQLSLARWQLRTHQPAEALAVLEQLATRRNLSPKARQIVDIYRVQALIYTRQNERAKKHADALLANPDTASVGYVMKAELAVREGDEKLGLEMLEKARAASPNNSALSAMISSLRGAQGDFEGVLDAAADVAGITRYQGQVQSTVGTALRGIAQTYGPHVALRKVDELLSKQPNDLVLIVLKVDLQLSLGQFDEAMQVLNDAQRRAPKDLDIRRLKAQAWMAQGRHRQALDALKEAMQLEIDRGVASEERDVNLVRLAAQAAIGSGEYADGVRYGDALRRAAPDSPRGFLLMAESYRKLKQFDDAAVVLEGYAKRHPNDFAIQITLADLYRQSGHVDQAVAVMQQARASRPDDIRYVVGELGMLLKEHRRSEARLLAQETIGASQNISHRLAVAKVFADHNQNIDAQSWGERALAVADSTNNAQVHGFLGWLYLRRARQENNDAFFPKARAQFELVRQTHPRDVIAGNNLAWLLATKFDEVDEAVRVVEGVRGNAPLEQLPPAFVDTMLDVYQRAGHTDKARALAEEAVVQFPREAPLLYHYGMLLAPSKPQQANQYLTRAVKLGLSPSEEAEAKRQLQRP